MRLVKPRRIVGLLLAAGMAVGITMTAAPARAANPWQAFIVGNTDGGLCLEADPGSNFLFQVYAQPCDVANKQSQWWRKLDQGGGVSKWVNSASGWCLYTDTRFDGSPIALWDCNANISNTRWTWNSIYGFGTMESRISGTTGHCVTLAGGEQALPGTPMQLRTCDSAPTQTENQSFLSFFTP